LEQRSRREVLGDIKQEWRGTKNHHLSNSTIPNMFHSLNSLNVAIIPISDNVLMDINSDPEAQQEAHDMELVLQQAQEKLRLVNVAWERCQEEWKRLVEEKV